MRAERLSEILDRVNERRSIDVADLAVEFSVSPATIRRDLQTLDTQGLLRRTHGGALPNPAGAELPIRYKASQRHRQKVAIGVAAAGLVRDGDVVGMTGGTTATEVARALANRLDITVIVVTNALNIAAEFIPRPQVRLVVIGGNARHTSYELVGPAAEHMVSRYNFDISFVGADGFTVAHGCTTHDEMEAHTDLAFIRQSRRTVLIADSTKFGRVNFARICGTQDIDILVTDSGIDERMRSAVASAHMDLVIADEDP